MSYRDTQRGWLHHLIYALAVFMAGMVLFLPPPSPWVRIALWIAAVVFIVLGFAFGQLTVSDEEDHLAIRFGPLPLFAKRIRYDEITAVEPGRTALVDGLGIHHVPGRGTTYNIAGCGCVELAVNGRTVRIGTDDVEGLTAFLRGHVVLKA